MFGSNKKGKGKEHERGGPVISRRDYLRHAVITAIAAKPTVKALGEAAYNAAVNSRYPIPPQKPTEVGDEETILAAGYGDSIMAGYGARGVPLTERVGIQAAKRGVRIRATSGAVDNSVARDIPTQIKDKPPEPRVGETLELHISTGHNDLKYQPDVVKPLQRLNAAPWNVHNWIGYIRARYRFRNNTRENITKYVGIALEQTGAKRATVYGFPPAQDMPGIDNIEQSGRNDRTVIADDRTIAGKAKRILAADISRQGTGGVVDAAADLREKGADITVGSMDDLNRGDFPRDQHPDARGADKIAATRAKLYKRRGQQ